ncbi:MAG: hypothetical protein J4478_03825 [Candidatus Diapherotrites archaeon]|uniref:Uncharacterized protein n=1 Tax=Candidatus Iainarchaeum sp. TaxID=3101447 RepID=A0A8T4KVZ1_9ARCH|nr:hypothetical protein [Candidatus Diapherotrites archaeon]
MGFWEKLLGGKPAEGKKALKLGDLESLAEKKLEGEKQAFLKKSSQAFETVQELVKTALENLGEIEKRDFTAEGENQYLRKIVQSSKQGFTSKMQALLEKAFPPKQKDFEPFRQSKRILRNPGIIHKTPWRASSRTLHQQGKTLHTLAFLQRTR